MNTPTLRRIAAGGLAGGLVLNLIDTPWSVLVMVPRLEQFNAMHQHVASPFAGPWFLLTHFAFMLGVAWLYSLARSPYGPGWRTALSVGSVMLLLNRAFGVGNVLLGWISLGGFLGFSISFVSGMLAASAVAARVIERRPAAQP
jgi:hypothetical protein